MLVRSALVAMTLLPLGCGAAAEPEENRNINALSDEVVAVAVGDSHACTLDRRGVVRCEGRVVPMPADVVEIAAGHDHACARTTAGSVRCWGGNRYGQLGDGTTTDRTEPVTVAGLVGVRGIAAGFARTCAVLGDGTVRCIGALEWDPHALLSDPKIAFEPTAIRGLTSVRAVALGSFHACALHDDGAVSCVGSNYFGQLGDGTTVPRTHGERVTTGVKALAAGTHHTCIVRDDGTVLCFGGDLVGQLGAASSGEPRTTPTLVPGVGRARAIAAGGDHTCVLLEGRSAPRCWGYNDVGQVGADPRHIVRAPIVPRGVDDVTTLAAGPNRTCAVREDGSVKCWGR